MNLDAKNELRSLRSSLELLDQELLALLTRRMSCARRIANAKREASLPIRDEHQEKEVLERVRQLGDERGLNPDRVEALFRLLLDWSVELQKEVLRSD